MWKMNRAGTRMPCLPGPACLAACVLFIDGADAQSSYPSRPIRMIVPYPPGGATGLLGRAPAERLAQVVKKAGLKPR